MNNAVKVAKEAGEGWGLLSKNERADWLDRIADSLERRFDEIASLESLDTGKPIRISRAVDATRSVTNFRFYAQQIREFEDENFTMEEEARDRNIDGYFQDEPTDKSTEKVLVYESYIRFDYDGDGIAELRKVICAGDGSYILENMPCDSAPFVTVTPIPMPHRFYGRSISELVEDIQLMKSTVMRQLLDNMYLTNNNRVAIMDGQVNIDDLLTNRPGGVVRTKQPPASVISPLASQPLNQQAMPLLEYCLLYTSPSPRD